MERPEYLVLLGQAEALAHGCTRCDATSQAHLATLYSSLRGRGNAPDASLTHSLTLASAPRPSGLHEFRTLPALVSGPLTRVGRVLKSTKSVLLVATMQSSSGSALYAGMCQRTLPPTPPTRHFCSAACAQCLSTAHALRSWHLPILSNGLHGGAQGTHWCYPPLCDEASWSTSGCAMCRQLLIEITEAAEA